MEGSCALLHCHGCVATIAMRASASLIAAALVLIARGVAALEFDLQSQHKCIFEVRRLRGDLLVFIFGHRSYFLLAGD